jgi:fructose-1,6-bisphosphatase
MRVLIPAHQIKASWKNYSVMWLAALFISNQAMAQEVVLASNYDGTNFSLNSYNVGLYYSAYTFSLGAN